MRMYVRALALTCAVLLAACQSMPHMPERGATATYGAAAGASGAWALGAAGPVVAAAAVVGLGLGWLFGSDPEPCASWSSTETWADIEDGQAGRPNGSQGQGTDCYYEHGVPANMRVQTAETYPIRSAPPQEVHELRDSAPHERRGSAEEWW